jgi:hypothetical protein
MPLQETFWLHFGWLTDRFGVRQTPNIRCRLPPLGTDDHSDSVG